MSQFENPSNPAKHPLRQCSKCPDKMIAIDAGEESYSPVALYKCPSCGHTVKIVPANNMGGWLGMGAIASIVMIAMIVFMSKPFDSLSVFWIGVAIAFFNGYPAYEILKNRRHPIEGAGFESASIGFFGNVIFLFVLGAVLMSGAAVVGLIIG